MSSRIAYLVNEYPKVSHTFIRREILALERQGFEIQRIALHGWNSNLVDEADRRERDHTRYVLKSGLSALLWALAHTLVTTPRRFWSAFLLAVRVGWQAERPLHYHIGYLAEACIILPLLKSFGATRLHAHFSTNATEVAMLTRALGGPPYSFTVHGTADFDNPPFLGITEKVSRADFVIASSSYARAQVYRWTGHEHWAKVNVVHCGLDSDYLSTKSAPPAAAPRLVCVGRLCKEKGQLLLLEAAHRLTTKGIEFELVLAGDGEIRSQVEELIAQLGLTRQVRVTGWVSGAQIRTELLAARALVLPSFAEGLPVVLMEAMALRRPVLATHVGGIPELVLAGNNGWLFPAGSIDDLAAAMEDCLSRTPVELERMGEAACSRVVRRHSIDIEVAKLGQLFRSAGLGAVGVMGNADAH